MEKQETDVSNDQIHVREVSWESMNLFTLVMLGKVRLEENMQSA
jgi:hypothetical protein